MDYVVYVDSNNRNSNLFPNSNSYTLFLSTPIYNISRVELVSAMLPNVFSSQYLTLDIAELRSTQTIVASALTLTGTSNSQNTSSLYNLAVPNSNAYSGAFAFVPVKAATSLASNVSTFSNTSFTYNNEFYSQNYKIAIDYPSRIDSLDRLTISWRGAGNGKLFYDSFIGQDLGRNMFLLRFDTIMVPDAPERPESLPPPVAWDSGDRQKMYVMIAALIMGLVIILFGRRRYA
jgi:hypothetical protein